MGCRSKEGPWTSHTAPPMTSAVTPKTFDPKKTYTGEQVFAKKQKIAVQVSSSKEEGAGEWKKHKSRQTSKREKAMREEKILAWPSEQWEPNGDLLELQHQGML